MANQEPSPAHPAHNEALRGSLAAPRHGEAYLSGGGAPRPGLPRGAWPWHPTEYELTHAMGWLWAPSEFPGRLMRRAELLSVVANPLTVSQPSTVDEALVEAVVRIDTRSLLDVVDQIPKPAQQALVASLTTVWPSSSPYTPTALGATQVIERATAAWRVDPDQLSEHITAMNQVAKSDVVLARILYEITGRVLSERSRIIAGRPVYDASSLMTDIEWRTRELYRAVAFGTVESNVMLWDDSLRHRVAWSAAISEVIAVIPHLPLRSRPGPQRVARGLPDGGRRPLLPPGPQRVARGERSALRQDLRNRTRFWAARRTVLPAGASAAAAATAVGATSSPLLMMGGAMMLCGAAAAVVPSNERWAPPRKRYGGRTRLTLAGVGLGAGSSIESARERAESVADAMERFAAGDHSAQQKYEPATPVAAEATSLAAADQGSGVDTGAGRGRHGAGFTAVRLPGSATGAARGLQVTFGERRAAVRRGLQALDAAWLEYLVDTEEAFLTMPRLRDDGWPATRHYRESMATLGDAVESLDAGGVATVSLVEAAENALHAAEEAWADARLAAAEAGGATLPKREQGALRRAAHHISRLEDPTLPAQLREEHLRQLRMELDRLDTVPISFEKVMETPALETVRLLALEAGGSSERG